MLNDLTDRINLLFVWSGPDVLQADVEMSADANLSLNHNLAAAFSPLFALSPPSVFFKVANPLCTPKKKVSVMITINWKGSCSPSPALLRSSLSVCSLHSREDMVKLEETP